MREQLNANQICDLLGVLLGLTCPVADASIDPEIEKHLMKLIDVVNWSLDKVYESASERKSPYGSARAVGERAYSALLEWKEWLQAVEDELA